jgi:hypothetical protein
MTIKWWLVAVRFYLYRLRVLSRAQRLFNDKKPGTLMERRLFGLTYVCDKQYSYWVRGAFLRQDLYNGYLNLECELSMSVLT